MELIKEEKRNIYIIGYYGHANSGDEQYRLTFKYIFDTYLPPSNIKYTIIHIDCDIIVDRVFNDNDIIILGGGDILTDYFLDQIILKFRNKPNKILAVSVGIPYIDIVINTNKLYIIDYIFLRTKQDLDIVKKYFHPQKIYYIPDISYFLLNIKNDKKIYDINLDNTLEILKTVKNTKKIICVTLSRHIYSVNNSNYNKLVDAFAGFCITLILKNYHIVLLPLNTNTLINGELESDILLNTDIYNKIKEKNLSVLGNITMIKFVINSIDIMSLYDNFYMCLSMRYHGCLYAIHKNIPFMPVYSTRKVSNLLTDINWDGIKLDVDENDIAIMLPGLETMLLNLYNKISCNYDILKESLNIICRDNIVNELNSHVLIDLIRNNYIKESFSDILPIDAKVLNLYILLTKIAHDNGYSDYRLIVDDKLRDVIIQVTSYHLTDGDINSVYNYGMKEKMFDIKFDYISDWKWVIMDNTSKSNIKRLYNNPYGLFNINFTDQVDYSGAHRAGWQYVYDNVKYLHNDNVDLLLDLYIDRTFHWNNKVNKIIGLIPYRKSWCGFIHHTFDTSFSEYNCYNLFENIDFVESLSCCKGIFLLYNYLKNKFDIELKKRCINVNTYALVHPTITDNIPLFDYNAFLSNDDKKLIHIGGWLRDIYSFYDLDLNSEYTKKTLGFWKKSYTLRKASIKSLNMNNYYPHDIFLNDLALFLSAHERGVRADNISNNGNICLSNVSNNGNNILNNWYKDMHDSIKYKITSVDIIGKLNNIEYDKILSNNIVFINLVDASAVNTLIEMIARNTPILINNHPAVVELLGEKYPLYFTDTYSNKTDLNTSICNVLTIDNIKNAHVYLCKMNKSVIKIETFINNFTKVIKELV